MLDQPTSGLPLDGIMPDGMSRADFLKAAGATGLVITASGTVISVLSKPAEAQDEVEGEFGPIFVEPWIYYPKYYRKRQAKKGEIRTQTNDECIPPPENPDENRRFCKPAAGQSGLMPNGTYLYINALEGTEDSKKFGMDADKSSEDSQSRIIKINYKDNTKSEFIKPGRNTGVSPPEEASEIVPGTPIADRGGNDGDMFCSHQCHLPNGNYLVVGGTNWYGEPKTGDNEGLVELEGNSRSRFYDWRRNKWFRTGDTIFGRWYGTVVPTEDGTPFVFGGVHKLEKPIYLPPQEPGEPPFFDSGGNVRFVEKLDLKTGKYKLVGGGQNQQNTARRSLPLQPRLKLLPNGHVSFNGSGQAFSPNGQDFEQAIWNNAASFDPETETWTEHGVAGQGCLEPFNVGSKLSTFEVPLTMEPDENGDYKEIRLLVGGGTWSGGGATNPGNYFANNQSRISRFFTPDGDPLNTVVTHMDTGPMFNAVESQTTEGEQPPEAGGVPLGRWFGDGMILPNGEVFVSSGADRDEVVFPGAEFPIIECEIFNQKDTTESPNGTWRVVGAMTNIRTYHNTNALLPTGQVIIGGHCPIPFGYVSHDSDVIPGTRNSDGRDPTFQLYSPKYMDDPNRPAIDYTGIGQHGTTKALTAKTGGNLVIPTSDGANIDDVVISRVSSGTHVNDTERRLVKLLVKSFNGTSVTAQMPKTAAELGGPGYYLAFIRTDVTDGIGLPSEGVFVKVNK